MDTVNYIIPMCNIGCDDFMDRVRNVQHILSFFLGKQKGVHVNCILIEQVVDETLPKFQDYIDHDICTVRYPEFVKPWLYNIAANRAVGDHMIIGESDVFVDDPFFLSNFVEYVKAKKYKWCFMWHKVRKLTRAGTDNLFRTGVADHVGVKTVRPTPGGCEGMGVYFRKDFWWGGLHGANEMFRKLGGNDNELAYRAHKMTRQYPIYPKTVTHLRHSRSSMKGDFTRMVNKGIRDYMQSGNNYTEFNEFLSKQDLGKIDGPLPVNKELIQKFSKITYKYILLVERWVEAIGVPLDAWKASLVEMIEKCDPDVVYVCAKDGEKYMFDDIPNVRFVGKIEPLFVRNLERSGFLDVMPCGGKSDI